MDSQIMSHALIAYQSGIVRLVLATVCEATPHLGHPPRAASVCDILLGSVARAEQDLYHRLNTFGVLPGYSRKKLVEIIERTRYAGLLEIVGGRQKGLVLTAEGRYFLTENANADVHVIPGAVNPELYDLAVRAGLVDALRRWRAAKAANTHFEEHTILPECLIRKIAAAYFFPADFLQAEWFDEIKAICVEHDKLIDRLKGAKA